MKNIYVGNLAWTTTEDELRSLFEDKGEVTRAVVIMDRETGRSRGFGFIEMPGDAEGDAAIAAFDGHDLGGRTLKVNEARPREDRSGGGGRGEGRGEERGYAGSGGGGKRW